MEQVFDNIKAMVNEDLVRKINAVFVFELKGGGTWYLDLKNGSGSAGKGAPPTQADATFIMDGQDLVPMLKGMENRTKKANNDVIFVCFSFAGQLKATSAMTGKLKIRGDTDKAMKLEMLMGSMQSKL